MPRIKRDKLAPLTAAEEYALEAFRNFLSWGIDPLRARDAIHREVPPAWWAYTLGATRWCPPAGEW